MISKKSNEKYSKYLDISSILNIPDIKIFHEKLLPNRKASLPHFHSQKNEIFFILSGNPTLYLNGECVELKKNDVLFFEPNKEIYHNLENKSDVEVEYLIIATDSGNDMVFYEQN